MPVVVRNIFEDYCKEKFRVKDCVAVTNGTSALITSLWSMDLNSDDEVITTPFTFIATPNSILIAGGKPVFVDVRKDNFLIDENKIESSITEKTKALLVVHLFGKPCNMDKIMSIASKHNLIVIEDCSQSFGVKYNDKMVGTIGDAGCFSFHKTKSMSTFEGGMLLTPNHSKLDSEKMRAITNQGQMGKYNHEYLGFNFRLAEPLCLQAYHNIKLHMKASTAELGMRDWTYGHYPKVVYDQPIYQKLGIKGDCPIAESISEKVKNYKK